jgi:methylated-DNA-[protein]-cysteine S-methyltransferase
MPITTGRFAGGALALAWHLEDSAWILDGIEMEPAASGLHSTDSHPQATRLLALLADPQQRSGAAWALAAVDRHGLSGFSWSVLETLALRVPPGAVVSYAELAARVGRPGAARAVGSVMRRNRWPLLVPCHRVVASGGRLGAFQGGCLGSIERKRALLEEEGIRFTAADRIAA